MSRGGTRTKYKSIINMRVICMIFFFGEVFVRCEILILMVIMEMVKGKKNSKFRWRLDTYMVKHSNTIDASEN